MGENVSSFKNSLTQIIKPLIRIKEQYLDNLVLVTDILSKLTITFGVMLIVGGLYLILNDISGLSAIQRNIAIQSAISTVSWVPGIPFSPADLIFSGTALIGWATWVIGIDLLLVGLGLWVRHRFARLAAIMVFLLAAVFQFIELLYNGFLGAPSAASGIVIDVIFVFLLFSRFDYLRAQKAPK